MRLHRGTALLLAGALLALGLGGATLMMGLVTQAPTPPQLATVTRQSFPVVATSSGTVVPRSQVQLQFPVSGQVTAINVTIGQSVAAGQTLATLEDTQQRATLAQAESGMATAQAQLAAAQNPLDPTHQLQLMQAVSSAQQALNITTTEVNNILATDANQIAYDQQQLTAAQQKYQTDGCGIASPPPDPTTCNNDQIAITQWTNTLQHDQHQQSVDQATGAARIANAQQALTSAQNALSNAGQQSPVAVQLAQAQVSSAQAQVAAAQAELAKTVLTAPVGGTVLAINGAVGEQVSAGSASTSVAPGSSGGILPNSGSGGTQSVANGGFITIADATKFVVAAPFSESDATKLKIGDTCTVSVDALPGNSLPCKVVGLASNTTLVNGVAEYYATLDLGSAANQLKEGMTANAQVQVAQVTDVLAAPNSALFTQGSKLFVDVWYHGKAVPTPVTVGATGAQYAEITSGLVAGQQVLVSVAHGLTGG